MGKKSKAEKKKEQLLARERHQAIVDFLTREPWYPILLDYLEIGQKRVTFHILLGNRPVLAERIQTTIGVSSVIRVAQIISEIRAFLRHFSKSPKGLNTDEFVIEIPDRHIRGDVGYYLACRRVSTGEYLNGKETREELWGLNKKRIAAVLKRYLREEADRDFNRKLQGTKYQELRLECGECPKRPIYSQEHLSNQLVERVGQHGRVWRSFSKRRLLNIRGLFILSCDTGTGKTTFLREQQLSFLQNGKRLSIFLDASDLEDYRYKTIDGLARCLAQRLEVEIEENDLTDFLREELPRDIVLLIDGFDQIAGMAYSAYLNKLVEVCLENRISVIIASRPTAVTSQEHNDEVKFLRLIPFDIEIQKAYFGKFYDRARDLCKSDIPLMGIPILALMVRNIIEMGIDKKVDSRTSLYRQFIDYILYEHQQDTLVLSEEERDATKEILSRISYEALAREKPYVQKCPISFFRKKKNEQEDLMSFTIDAILKCGLINLILDRPNKHQRWINFTHQSFQEYFAAEWISKDEKRIDNVMKEYWNPKWQEVIRFLSGTERGGEIIQKIYSGPECDDPLSSRLVLAASCVGQTRISDEFVELLSSQLISHLRQYPNHQSDILKTIVKTRLYHSIDCKRAIMLDLLDYYRPGEDFFEDTEIAWLLLSDENFQIAFDRQMHSISPWACRILHSWAPFHKVQRETIEALIDDLRIHNKAKQAVRGLVGLAPWLDEDHVAAIIDISLTSKGKLAGRLSMLEGVTCPLTSGLAKSLIMLLECSKWCHLPKKMTRSDDENGVSQLLNWLWHAKGHRERWNVAECLQDQLSEDHVQVVWEKLNDDDIEVVECSVMMLEGKGHILTYRQIARILELSKIQSLRSSVAWTVGSMADKLEEPERHTFLDLLQDVDSEVRVPVISAMRQMKNLITEKQKDSLWDLLMRFPAPRDEELIEKGYEDEPCTHESAFEVLEIIRTLIHVSKELTKKRLWQMIRIATFFDVGIYPTFYESVAAKIGPCLDRNDLDCLLRETIVEASVNEHEWNRTTTLVQFLDIRRLETADLEYLFPLLDSANNDVRCSVWKHLTRALTLGKIQAYT